LSRHASRFHNSFQNDDQFEVVLVQIFGSDFPEWRIFVDFVTDGDGPDEEDSVAAVVVTHVHVVLVHRQDLAFGSNLLADHHDSDMCLHKMGPTNVADPKE